MGKRGPKPGYASPLAGQGRAVPWLKNHANYDGDECLLWPFARLKNGYGNFGHFGKQHYAHRYMCELVRGEPPTPKHQAAHSCGNGHRGCVNPNHLSWKTNKGNALDRSKHGTEGTNPYGNRTPLTTDTIAAIKGMLGTATVTKIAARFGVSRRTIERVRAGWAYKAARPSATARWNSRRISC